MPTTVAKGTLKAKMLEYFRRVERTGEELIVTSNGVPVLKVVPYETRRPLGELFDEVRGKMRYQEEDILAPTEEEWSER